MNPVNRVNQKNRRNQRNRVAKNVAQVLRALQVKHALVHRALRVHRVNRLANRKNVANPAQVIKLLDLVRGYVIKVVRIKVKEIVNHRAHVNGMISAILERSAAMKGENVVVNVIRANVIPVNAERKAANRRNALHLRAVVLRIVRSAPVLLRVVLRVHQVAHLRVRRAVRVHRRAVVPVAQRRAVLPVIPVAQHRVHKRNGVMIGFS